VRLGSPPLFFRSSLSMLDAPCPSRGTQNASAPRRDSRRYQSEVSWRLSVFPCLFFRLRCLFSYARHRSPLRYYYGVYFDCVPLALCPRHIRRPRSSYLDLVLNHSSRFVVSSATSAYRWIPWGSGIRQIRPRTTGTSNFCVLSPVLSSPAHGAMTPAMVQVQIEAV
jgi:hypothetical protein